MAKAASKTEDDATDVSSTLGTISFGTLGTETEQGKGDDKLTPIVQQIISREKENQEAVKKLKQLLVQDGKRCIKMALKLQTKKKVVENLKKQNETTCKIVKEAEKKLEKVQQQKDEKPTTKEKEKLNAHKDLEQLLQSLQQILNDLTREVQAKEEIYSETKKQKTEKGAKGKGSDDKKPKQTGRQKRNELLTELKMMVKYWLSRLLKTLSSGKNKEAETIPDFKIGVQKILQYTDSGPKLKADFGKVKAQKEEREKFKAKIHDKVAKRLANRKALEKLPSKFRRDFEQIAQKREMTETIQDQQTNLAVHYCELYQWGSKELERDDDRIKKVGRQIKETKDRCQDAEKQSDKHRKTKNDELKNVEGKLAAVETENRDLRNRLTNANKGLEKNNARRKEICTEVKDIAVLCKSPDQVKTKEKMEKDMQEEQNQQRQLDDSINKLQQMQARQEKELKSLDEEITETKRRNAEEPNRVKIRSQEMQQRLANLTEMRKNLKKRIAQENARKQKR